MNGVAAQLLIGRTARAISFPPKSIGLAVFCLLVAACRLGGLEERDPPASALAAARAGETRLAGAPWSAPGRPLSKDILRKAGRATALALQSEITADNLRNDAVVNLLVGNPALAIEELSKAAELAPWSARVWSDLAAAHLRHSAMASDPYGLVQALAAANQALLHDSRLLAGRHNRALALERLSLRAQAAAEWQLVAQREKDSSWAREAREHAKGLAREPASPGLRRALPAVQEAMEQGRADKLQAIVAGSPQEFREHAEELLTLWALAEKEHREPEARRHLVEAKQIAHALTAIGGDRMAADTIAQIGRTRGSDSRRHHRLAVGFLAYSEGLAFAARDLYPQALPRFQEAHRILSGEASPFSSWAAYWIARCIYQNAKYKKARELLLQLTGDPANAPYETLKGRSFSLLGLMDGIEGRHTDSLASLAAAEVSFRKVKEAAYAAKASALLATEPRRPRPAPGSLAAALPCLE